MIPAYCQQWRNGFDDAVKTYQRSIYDIALKECGERRGVAVDAGAHVGIFARRMVDDFEHVHAFEPVLENFRCLDANINKSWTNKMTAWGYALGDHQHMTKMRNPSPNNSGAWEIGDGTTGEEVEVRTLDSFFIEGVDLFKLDIQGSEVAALHGAEATIRKCRPIILTEVMSATKTEIRDILVNLGYRLKREEGDDQVWVPN